MTREQDYELLNTPGQRFKVYVGFGDEIRFITDTSMNVPPITLRPQDTDTSPYRATAVMGPHRLSFVGDAVTFYGGYSYGRNRRPVKALSWACATASELQTELDTRQYYPNGPLEATAHFRFNYPGVHYVTLYVTDAETDAVTSTTRQVIVFPDRADMYDGVIAIGSLSGSSDQGGWSCSVTVADTLDWMPKTKDIQGYLPVVIAAEASWEINGFDSFNSGLPGMNWSNRIPGLNWQVDDYRDDPSILFSGYIDRATISIDADKATTTFEVKTANFLLEQMQTASWGFFTTDQDGAGIILPDKITTADVILHMLHEHTNFLKWNDARLWYGNFEGPTQAHIDVGLNYKDWTFNQGTYWSNIRDIVANEYCRAWCDRTGCLLIVPDRNFWETQVFHWSEGGPLARPALEQFPIGVIADEEKPSALVPTKLTIGVSYSGRTSYYKLTGTLAYMNEEWGASYPKERPGPGSGRWVLEQGKYVSDFDRNEAWARFWRFVVRGYAQSNSRFTLQAGFGLQPYWRLGDVIALEYTDPQTLTVFEPTNPITNHFEVEQISYEIAIDTQQFMVTYGFREVTIHLAPDAGDPPPVPTPPEE